jgi:hypothetical protein
VGLNYIYRRIAYQSTHCGKVDWKVSVQVHLITLMNAPGLKMTFNIDQWWCDMAIVRCGDTVK